jgi:hypothetical protein
MNTVKFFFISSSQANFSYECDLHLFDSVISNKVLSNHIRDLDTNISPKTLRIKFIHLNYILFNIDQLFQPIWDFNSYLIYISIKRNFRIVIEIFLMLYPILKCSNSLSMCCLKSYEPLNKKFRNIMVCLIWWKESGMKKSYEN